MAVGASTGNFTGPHAEKDRNAFDVWDYKLSDLGAKPTNARWKKWRRDFEGFIDTIEPSWKNTSGLLRELRHCELTFTEEQVETAVQSAKARGDKAPEVGGFDSTSKKDVLYRLLMPRLDEVLGIELARPVTKTGSSCSGSSSASWTHPRQMPPLT